MDKYVHIFTVLKGGFQIIRLFDKKKTKSLIGVLTLWQIKK